MAKRFDTTGVSLRFEEPNKTTVWASWATITSDYVHPKTTVTEKKKKVKKVAYEFKEYRLTWSYYVPGVSTPYTPAPSSVTDWKTGVATFSVPSNAHRISLTLKVIYTKKAKDPPKTKDWYAELTTTTAADYTPAKPTLSHTITGSNLTITSRTTAAEFNKGTKYLGVGVYQFYRASDGSEVRTNYYKSALLWYNNVFETAWTLQLDPGFYYRYCAFAYNYPYTQYRSELSDWSANVYTVASKPKKLRVVADTSTSVRISFTCLGYVESYEGERATEEKYLGTSSEFNQSFTINEESREPIEHTVSDVLSGLETGHVYYFRIRAKSGNSGDSEWSETVSITMGREPGPPSTYSSKTSATLGETVNLYWVHNTQDGSSQTKAQIAFYLNGRLHDRDLLGGGYEEVTNPYIDDDINKDKTLVLPVSFTTFRGHTFEDGDVLYWKVRTRGVFAGDVHNVSFMDKIVVPSETDVSRSVSFTLKYIPANLSTFRVLINDNRILESYYTVNAKTVTIDFSTLNHVTPGKTARVLILYQVQNGGYGDWSELRRISVYSKPEAQLAIRTGWTIDPENPKDITPIYDVEPVDEITSYPIAVTMGATPASQNVISFNLKITNAGDKYEVDNMYGDPITVGAGEIVYQRYFDVDTDPGQDHIKTIILYPNDVTFKDGARYTFELESYMDSGLSATTVLERVLVSLGGVLDFYPLANIVVNKETFEAYISPYCYDIEYGGDEEEDEEIDEDVTIDDIDAEALSDNVVLDVYRLETDGTFTLICPNIPNTDWKTVTDSHPALDYARYRIVARKTNTAMANYVDYEEEMGVHSLVIQWNEDWINYEINDIRLASEEFETNDEAMIIPVHQQGVLVLPWNIDTTEDSRPDVSLVEYIGREHPVSYYGTQRGQTASWSTDIDKTDTETLFKLRRLSRFMGDCYVREPSGTGYWANVQVNWSQTHNEPAIPVSISVTRVEGIPEYNPELEEGEGGA